MMIFTNRDLESLTSLRANWERLYRNELLRLLNETGNAEDPSAEPAFVSLLRSRSLEPRGQNNVRKMTTTKHN